MRFILATAIAWAAAGCSYIDISDAVPPTFTAIPESSEFTGWILDHCSDATPIRLEELDCAQIGGEIYRVRLTDIKSTDGQKLTFRSYLLVPHHALLLTENSKEIWAFEIKEATSELQSATGVKYIAVNYERGVER